MSLDSPNVDFHPSSRFQPRQLHRRLFVGDTLNAWALASFPGRFPASACTAHDISPIAMARFALVVRS